MRPFPDSWDEAAMIVADWVALFASGDEEPLEDWIEFLADRKGSDNWEDWLSVAVAAMKEWGVDPAVATKDLVTVLRRKHHDYGPQNLLRFGTYGLLIRCWDKVCRLKNLQGKDGVAVQDEAVADTYRDLVGYAICGVLICRGWWSLPLHYTPRQHAKA